MKPALVLLSGGTDSAVALAEARKRGRNVKLVFFNFRQKNVTRERNAVIALAQHYGTPVIDFYTAPSLFSGSPLTDGGEMPDGALRDIQPKGISPVEVPFRNGVLLSAATTIAIREGCGELWHGIHAEDGTEGAYPDNSHSFLSAMAAAIWHGSGKRCMLISPFGWTDKTGVIAEGLLLNVPFHLTYTCYRGVDPSCGTCIACDARREAFRRNEREDPIRYADASASEKEESVEPTGR